jgi:hypothetical protein
MIDCALGAAPEKLKALLWSELVPGNYWIYAVGDPTAPVGKDSQFATVILWQGGLWITHGGRLEALTEAWSHIQFVACRRPPEGMIAFQEQPAASSRADREYRMH